ncbi:MAG TPA: HAMP domain-containing histidine kinase, partial [Candidatus Aenigmarchaeota archaeon]|nr:HAMP domain-containing histidine kinase [Candidatus Aenigmarchaeota archaeon]
MIILTLLYFVIRFLLRPLKILDKAVVEISAGNLDHQIDTNRRDEFGDLIRSFNQMASRLKQMLKTRDQLLLDVSHEMRSPLTRIKVALEFLEDNPAKETIREDLTEIELMTNELLESERLDSVYGGLHLKTINLTEFLQQTISVFNSKKQLILLNTKISEVPLRADPERLQIAFSNLFQNALKYSHSDKQPVMVSITFDGENVQIEIQDFGQGIPEQDIPFIFEPFYRVDKSRSKDTGGYGLGLSLTKKIIEAHRGTIEVHSSLNKGTRFTIKFNTKKHHQWRNNAK